MGQILFHSTVYLYGGRWSLSSQAAKVNLGELRDLPESVEEATLGDAGMSDPNPAVSKMNTRITLDFYLLKYLPY